jgi:hypothetical protein
MKYDGKKRCKRYPKHTCSCGTKGYKRDGNVCANPHDIERDVTYSTKPVFTVKHANKKDTKKWCRGKAGVEHVKHWQPMFPYSISKILDTYKEVCSTCGKQFRYCSHWYYNTWHRREMECICGEVEKPKVINKPEYLKPQNW